MTAKRHYGDDYYPEMYQTSKLNYFCLLYGFGAQYIL